MMPDEPEEREILSVKDIALYLRLHPITVYRMAQQGKIPSFHVGGSIKFKRSMIEKWIAGKQKGEGNG